MPVPFKSRDKALDERERHAVWWKYRKCAPAWTLQQIADWHYLSVSTVRRIIFQVDKERS